MALVSPLETEAKLTCSTELDERELLTWLARRADVSGPVELQQRDLYLDTRADELLAAGLAVRVRQSAGVRSLELKPIPLERALVVQREEMVLALRAEEDPGDRTRAWVLERFGLELSESPREVLTLTTTRRRFGVTVDTTRMELCVDAVAASEPHGRRASFAELELELLAGDVAVLKKLAAELSRRDGLLAAGGTKLERARLALGLGGPRHGNKPPPARGDARLVEAAQQTVGAWWATARGHLPGVMVGLDPEHVHKMRVAMRRLRTALRVYHEAFDPDLADDFRQRLRAFGRRLGAVRDYDVQRGALPQWRARFVGVPRSGWDDVDARLVRRRERARAQVLGEIRSRAWAELEQAATRCLGGAQAGLRHTVAAAAPRLVVRRAERARRALSRLRDRGTAEDAHALRIELKNLRYTLEFFAAVLTPTVEATVESLAELQEQLGEIQDAVQTGRLAGELLAMAPLPTSDCAAALGSIIGYGRAASQWAAGLALAACASVELESLLDGLDRIAAREP